MMKIIAVDDEQLALDNIVALLRQQVPTAEVVGFASPNSALAWLVDNGADVAMLDIEMSEMNGIILAKRCKDICPRINIIFVTGYDDYTLAAMQMHASGYLMKPVRTADLLAELDNLRNPLPPQPIKRVRVQTFGNFEVFVDGKPLDMPLARCRECLAYLVDRKGARVTIPELAALLWEQDPYDKRLQNRTYRVVSDLMAKLAEVGIQDIVCKHRKDIAIRVDSIDCDYYRFLAGDVRQINAFMGEYMTNYAWAEFTLAGLLQAGKG